MSMSETGKTKKLDNLEKRIQNLPPGKSKTMFMALLKEARTEMTDDIIKRLELLVTLAEDFIEHMNTFFQKSTCSVQKTKTTLPPKQATNKTVKKRSKGGR